MVTSFLPGLRQLRAPLAAGTVWLIALWIAWGRQHPDFGLPADFDADLDRAAGILGTGAILGGLLFAAYCIGMVWTSFQYDVIRNGGILLRRHVPRLAYRLTMVKLIPGSRSRILRSFTHQEGFHADLLELIGVKRPDQEPNDAAACTDIMAALADDLEWFLSVVPDRAPALANRYARVYGETRFAAALVVPLPVCAFVFLIAAVPGRPGVLWGLGVCVVGMYSLAWAAALTRVIAFRIMLQAVRLGVLELPALTAEGLRHWGPADLGICPTQSDTNLSGHPQSHSELPLPCWPERDREVEE